MTELARRIENFLFLQRRWVTSAELEKAFGIRARALRALDDKPGLCSNFAISGQKGFKHIRWATDAEFTHSYNRARKHGIAELIGARRRKRYRQRILSVRPPPVHELATGQAVMSI
jgi:hypothetical protein